YWPRLVPLLTRDDECCHVGLQSPCRVVAKSAHAERKALPDGSLRARRSVPFATIPLDVDEKSQRASENHVAPNHQAEEPSRQVQRPRRRERRPGQHADRCCRSSQCELSAITANEGMVWSSRGEIW